MYNFRSILFSICLAFLPLSFGYADDDKALRDSSTLQPQSVNADPGNGYVLARGDHQMYCGGGDGSYWGCTFPVSNRQCLPGFYPEAMFAPRKSNYAGICALRGYFLDAPRPYANGAGGYSVTFKTAYANFVMCDDRNITVTYTIMCLRTR